MAGAANIRCRDGLLFDRAHIVDGELPDHRSQSTTRSNGGTFLAPELQADLAGDDPVEHSASNQHRESILSSVVGPSITAAVSDLAASSLSETVGYRLTALSAIFVVPCARRIGHDGRARLPARRSTIMDSERENSLANILAEAGPDRFRRIGAVFDHVVELSPEGRIGFLEELARFAPELHAEVLQLLAVDEDALRFFESPVAKMITKGAAYDWPATATSLAAGDRIGPCTIRRTIAAGGMGVVYEADQEKPRRRVALKVLRPDGATEAAVRRFELEAEILGRLHHPGIAQIHQAGIHRTKTENSPYIVMEFIEGSSLTDYVDGRDPSLRERLELFAEICDGVHHAHQNGIIHRDLKPPNVLVDLRGRPKIVDFGVARNLGGSADPSIFQTLEGQIVGTVAYMSPEQARGDLAAIDTRTDIYSLGVMLYEILGGEVPCGLRGRSFTDAIRAIQKEMPRPVGELDRKLKGDVETIVSKTLEKDRSLRYPSAAALAEDIRRFLGHEPIAARPLTGLGRFARWSKREPWKAALLLVVILSLPTIAVLATVYAVNLPRIAEAKQAELERKIDGLLSDGYYEIGEGDPHRAVNRFEEVLELDSKSGEAAAGIVLARLEMDDPDAALQVLDASSASLGGRRVESMLRARALAQKGHAARAQRLLSAAPPPGDAVDFYLMGQSLIAEGHAGRPLAFDEAVRRHTQSILHSTAPRALFFEQLAHAASHARDAAAVQDAARALTTNWPESAASHFWAGLGWRGVRQLDQALAAFEQVTRLDPDDPKGLYAQGWTLENLERYDDAVNVLDRVIERWPDHANALNARGLALRKLGALDDAIASHEESLRYRPGDARTLCNLGIALSEKGLSDRAVTEFNSAIEKAPRDGELHYELAQHLDRRGQFVPAMKIYQTALRLLPEDPRIHNSIGIAHRRGGETDEAIRCFRAAIRLDQHQDFPYLHNNLGNAYAVAGRLEEALAAFRVAGELMPDTAKVHANLGFALKDSGLVDDAIVSLGRSAGLGSQQAVVYLDLGECLSARARHSEALVMLRRGLELCAGNPDQRAIAAQRVEECEAVIAEEERMQAVLDSGLIPDDPVEALRMARLALRNDRPLTSARWFRAAFEKRRDLEGQHGFEAARAAGLASDQVIDEAVSTGEPPGVWRKQCLTWLSAALDAHEARLDDGLSDAREARLLATLTEWTSEPAFAAMRGESIDSIPEGERGAWHALWLRVTELLDELE